MKVEMIYPIASAHGSITKGYYIRTLANGKQVVSRKPNRKGHVKTEREAANQRRFADRYCQGSGREVVAEWSRGNIVESGKLKVESRKWKVESGKMKAMYKAELAQRMQVSGSTMTAYMRSIEHLLPHYHRTQKLLTPDQVRIVSEHFCIDWQD